MLLNQISSWGQDGKSADMGYCWAGALQSDNQRIIGVHLGTPRLWRDKTNNIWERLPMAQGA